MALNEHLDQQRSKSKSLLNVCVRINDFGLESVERKVEEWSDGEAQLTERLLRQPIRVPDLPSFNDFIGSFKVGVVLPVELERRHRRYSRLSDLEAWPDLRSSIIDGLIRIVVRLPLMRLFIQDVVPLSLIQFLLQFVLGRHLLAHLLSIFLFRLLVRVR